jgi:uncharacterized glyoxalase superfamily protein PhnB
MIIVFLANNTRSKFGGRCVIQAIDMTLYSLDIERALTFYRGFGFVEAFRYPAEGPPHHVELTLNGFRLGIADIAKASADHGFTPQLGGHTAELVFWNDDTDDLYEKLIAGGATVISAPHDWLEDLRVAWVADPDGNPIQLVQKARKTRA